MARDEGHQQYTHLLHSSDTFSSCLEDFIVCKWPFISADVVEVGPK